MCSNGAFEPKIIFTNVLLCLEPQISSARNLSSSFAKKPQPVKDVKYPELEISYSEAVSVQEKNVDSKFSKDYMQLATYSKEDTNTNVMTAENEKDVDTAEVDVQEFKEDSEMPLNATGLTETVNVLDTDENVEVEKTMEKVESGAQSLSIMGSSDAIRLSPQIMENFESLYRRESFAGDEDNTVRFDVEPLDNEEDGGE